MKIKVSSSISTREKSNRSKSRMEKKSLIILLWVIIFTFLLITPVCSQADDGEFVYYGFAGGKNNVADGSNISIDGIAYLEYQDNVDEVYLRLTDNTTNSYGHAFHPSPLNFTNKNGKISSFSTCFAFAIVPEDQSLGGGGLAFVISYGNLSGAYPAQYLGLLNTSTDKSASNHLLAVEFDTFKDFEFQDIDGNHIGIDINSLTSNASVSAAYWYHDGINGTRLTLNDGDTIKAWIDYDSESRLLNVTVSPSNEKPPKPILSYEVDLSLVFKESMYVGFSASTGSLASSHYVFGWSFKVNGTAEDLNLSKLPSLPKPENDDDDTSSPPSVPEPAGNDDDTCADDCCSDTCMGFVLAAVIFFFFFCLGLACAR